MAVLKETSCLAYDIVKWNYKLIMTAISEGHLKLHDNWGLVATYEKLYEYQKDLLHNDR